MSRCVCMYVSVRATDNRMVGWFQGNSQIEQNLMKNQINMEFVRNCNDVIFVCILAKAFSKLIELLWLLY